MNISNAKAVLTEHDILSIIEDYVQVEGLKIDSIDIKEIIVVRGSYKKRITIPFEIKLAIGSIKDNILNVKILKLNVLKIAILKKIKNIILKKMLKEFTEYGISVEKDTIAVNLEKVSKRVPSFCFVLNSINITESRVEVELENFVYSENKEIPKIEEKNYESSLVKMQGEYGRVRDKIVKKVPDKYEKIAEYAMIIPDVIVLLWRLFKDKRVKIKIKIMVAGITAYLASPIDILPDFIPLIGTIDDVAIAFFALNAIINEVPEEVILENWQGEENIILLTKEVINYISKAVGSYNVAKLLEVIKKIFKKGQVNYKLAAKREQMRSSKQNFKLEEAVTVDEERDNIH